MDGVLATQALWLGKAEGVEVTFDPRRLPFERLLERAAAAQCDRAVWTTTQAQFQAAEQSVAARAVPLASMTGASAPRRDREPKYYLLQTPLKHVPMTPAQAARVNAVVRVGGLEASGWRDFLSPAQLAILDRVLAQPETEWPVVVDVALDRAWQSVGTGG